MRDKLIELLNEQRITGYRLNEKGGIVRLAFPHHTPERDIQTVVHEVDLTAYHMGLEQASWEVINGSVHHLVYKVGGQ